MQRADAVFRVSAACRRAASAVAESGPRVRSQALSCPGAEPGISPDLVVVVTHVRAATQHTAGTQAAASVKSGRATGVFYNRGMFVHLRLHTEFSVVDGTNRIDEIVKAAAA